MATFRSDNQLLDLIYGLIGGGPAEAMPSFGNGGGGNSNPAPARIPLEPLDATRVGGPVENSTRFSGENPILGWARDQLAPAPGRTYGNVLPLAGTPDSSGNMTNVGPGLPNSVRDAGLGLLDLLEGPKLGTVTPRATMALAGMGLGAGQALGESGALGTFGGTMARTAPTGGLEWALSLEKDGLDPSKIWQMTGWMRGPEGRMKFEIPDQWSKINPKYLRAPTTNAPENFYHINYPKKGDPDYPLTLGNFLVHPDLFEAYPDLANVKVDRVPLGNTFTTMGAYQEKSGPDYPGTLYLRGDTLQNIHETTLHEVQHGIQGLENFAKGGNVGSFLTPEYKQLYDNINPLRIELDSKLRDMGLNPYIARDLVDRAQTGGRLGENERAVVTMLDKAGLTGSVQKILEAERVLHAHEDIAHNSYHHLAGEAEARMVTDRHPLTDYERSITFPRPADLTQPQIVRPGIDTPDNGLKFSRSEAAANPQLRAHIFDLLSRGYTHGQHTDSELVYHPPQP